MGVPKLAGQFEKIVDEPALPELEMAGEDVWDSGREGLDLIQLEIIWR